MRRRARAGLAALLPGLAVHAETAHPAYARTRAEVGSYGGSSCAVARKRSVASSSSQRPARTKARVDAVEVGDVSHAHRATERVTVGAGRHPSDEHAVAPDGLVAEQERLGVVEGEHHEAAGEGLVALAEERVASGEGRPS